VRKRGHSKSQKCDQVGQYVPSSCDPFGRLFEEQFHNSFEDLKAVAAST
jgi:hypothetical protein